MKILSPMQLHYTQSSFLDIPTCAHLRKKVDGGQFQKGGITKDGKAIIDERVRKMSQTFLPYEDMRSIEVKLLAIKSQIEEYFQLQLSQCQTPTFFRYHIGDFFKLHQDNEPQNEKNPDYIKKRKVAVVLFLNNQSASPKPEHYVGGNLNLYVPNTDIKNQIPIAIQGKEGALVAFPANWWHEVTPITFGYRYTVVSWFS